MDMHGSSPRSYSSPMYGGSPPQGPWLDGYGSSPPGMQYLPIPPGYCASPPYSPPGYPPGYGYHYHPHYPAPSMGMVAPAELGAAMADLSMHESRSQHGMPRSGSGTSLRRASARIARSNRAWGAINAEEYAFDPETAHNLRSGSLWTTVMIRNIPNKYNQAFLLRHLENGGCKGTFDFLYLPVDFRNACNLGYAFVNFLTPDAMISFFKSYHGVRWRGEESSTKICEVTYGRVQGTPALVSHFKAARFPTGDPSTMPLIFTKVEGGVASCPLAISQYLDTSPDEGPKKEEELAASWDVAESNKDPARDGETR